MPSSPADQHELSAELAERLQQVRERYDGALEALLCGEIDRAARSVTEAQALVADLPGGGPDTPALRDQHRRTVEAHSRLAAAMQAAHTELRAELDRSRDGRRALRGYGRRRDRSGRSLDRDA